MSGQTSRRMWGRLRPLLRARAVAIVAASLVLFGLVIYGGGGWFFSSVIRSEALLVERSPLEYPLEVVDVGEETITLEVVDGLGDDEYLSGGQWDQDLWVGVGTADVSGLVGPAITRTDTRAIRQYVPPEQGQLRVGDRVDLDVRAFWPTPEVLGEEYRAVRYSNQLGSFPAWVIPGARKDIWAIHVHGKGGDLTEPMRLETSTRSAGLTSMVIRYRNGVDAPAAPGGLIRYGQTEWQDLEAAVDWAIDNGAERFVMTGISAGGAIVLGFLEHSEHADLVDAIVLDSPATDIGGVIQDRAGEVAIIPGVLDVGPGLTWSAMSIAQARFDISWDDTNYNARAEHLSVPTFIWATEHDETVPIGTIREFAQRAPEGLVQLEVETHPEAGHVMAWNADPERYDALTQDFLGANVPAMSVQPT